jgi:hypothetical protein
MSVAIEKLLFRKLLTEFSFFSLEFSCNFPGTDVSIKIKFYESTENKFDFNLEITNNNFSPRSYDRKSD